MGLSTGQVYSYPSPTRGSSSKVYRKSDLLIKLVGRKKRHSQKFENISYSHFEDRVLECLLYLSLQLSFWSIAAAARNLKEKNLIFSNMMQLINIKTGKLK